MQIKAETAKSTNTSQREQLIATRSLGEVEFLLSVVDGAEAIPCVVVPTVRPDGVAVACHSLDACGACGAVRCGAVRCVRACVYVRERKQKSCFEEAQNNHATERNM